VRAEVETTLLQNSDGHPLTQGRLTDASACSTFRPSSSHKGNQISTTAMHPPERRQQKTATPTVTLWGRRTTQRAAWVTACISLILLIMVPSLVWGHTDLPPIPPSLQDSTSQLSAFVDVPSSESFPHRGTRPGLLLAALFFLASLGFSGITRSSRKVAALCFVLILSLYAFSIAIHSVHHLSAPEKVTECLGFLASQHVSGTSAEAWDFYAPGLAVEGPPLGSFDTLPATFFFRPNQPRAPPSLPA
jgi:hypothetical protein